MKMKTRILTALAFGLFTLPALAGGKHHGHDRGWHGNGHAHGHYKQQERRDRAHARHDRRLYREGYRDGYRDGSRHGDLRYYSPPRVVHRPAPRHHHDRRGGFDSLFGKLVIVLD